MQQSINAFSTTIFGEKSKQVNDNEDSCRRFKLENTSINKSAFSNKGNNSKIEEIELEFFNEKNQNITDDLTEEIIDTLDIEKLRSILKTKCRKIHGLDQKLQSVTSDLTKEKENTDELKTIIRIQQKEMKRNNKIIMELKNEINIWREKANTVKTSEIEKMKINKPSNYFISEEKKEEKLQINDLKDTKIIENQFLGDSEVSISSKIENNNIYKRWFFYEKNMTINLDDWELKFRKLNDSDKIKINFMQKKEFKFIDFEIFNISDSSLVIGDLQIDSTERITIN